MKKDERWIWTFRYAWEGIRYGIRTQRNLRIHLVCALLAAGAAAFFHLSLMKWAILILIISLVIAAELVNTAIEAVVDMVSPDYHPLAKVAKDTAAGAVLVCAIASVFIALCLFFHPVIYFFKYNS
ncbi:undecaprenol kinase [Paenibacillus shirakamiensis]|uniref:Undecaprenol kinase n=1 Tax=Paenibacillus shirakamiensis TaxID=1265935 RepID=A0ABS4JDI2_9BACL|nr:diacylglycerol kinase family protein [Paenibacillus shirakamiensis]MBP1999171.1 undecaprenol kinase [Paenibacillus shirakamiensis]